MNYIEFEIGDKLRGFKFGTRFLSEFLNDLDTDISGMGEELDKNPFRVRPLALYFAHFAHCESKGQPVTFNKVDFENWIDDLDEGISNKNVVEAMRVLIESVRSHLPKGDKPEEPKKK